MDALPNPDPSDPAKLDDVIKKELIRRTYLPAELVDGKGDGYSIGDLYRLSLGV
jgi:hypothetical protein